MPSRLRTGSRGAGPFIVALAAAIGCMHPGRASLAALPATARLTEPATRDVATAIEGRIADLKARGGDCLAYGQLLESSLAGGRITVRPYMWRVGPNLASAQARPSGEITLAREIDSLNVGVRTLDDVEWSAEHEAVHLAFRIPSGVSADEAVVDRVVRACR